MDVDVSMQDDGVIVAATTQEHALEMRDAELEHCET